jgi:hypothetical protein
MAEFGTGHKPAPCSSSYSNSFSPGVAFEVRRLREPSATAGTLSPSGQPERSGSRRPCRNLGVPPTTLPVVVNRAYSTDRSRSTLARPQRGRDVPGAPGDPHRCPRAPDRDRDVSTVARGARWPPAPRTTSPTSHRPGRRVPGRRCWRAGSDPATHTAMSRWQWLSHLKPASPPQVHRHVHQALSLPRGDHRGQEPARGVNITCSPRSGSRVDREVAKDLTCPATRPCRTWKTTTARHRGAGAGKAARPRGANLARRPATRISKPGTITSEPRTPEARALARGVAHHLDV